MKKLLLIGINARYTHSNLALLYLKSMVDKSNSEIEADICELNINQSHLELLESITDRSADYLALSVYIWNVEIIKKLLLDLKHLSEKAVFILGGPEVSYQTQKWQEEYPWIDYLVSGSGEKAILRILDDKKGVQKGVVYGESVTIDELPFPYPEIPVEGKECRYFYYESSRGCPFRCAYCLSSRLDQELNYRSIDNVKNELEYFVKMDYRHIKLVDRTFNAKPERAREIWETIKLLYMKYPASKTGFHFEIHPQLLEEQDFKLIKSIPAGRFRFELGIQTLNDQVMKIIHRRMDWEKVKINLQKLNGMGNIHTHLDLIAGLPGEDFDSLSAGFDEVIRVGGAHLQLGFLKVLSGTEMCELVEKYQISYQSKAPYQVLQTGKMSWKELCRVKRIEEITEIYYNSEKFETVLKAVFDEVASIWSLFEGLAGYYHNNKIDFHLRNWEKSAYYLWRYLKENKLLQENELMDHLRLDWCQQARSHYYPEFLRDKILDQARETGYGILRTMKQRKKLLQVNEIRQAIFFLPVSCKYDQKEILVFYGKQNEKNIVRLRIEN